MNLAMFRVHRAAWAQRVRTLLVQVRGAAGQQEDAAEVWQQPGVRAVPVVRASTEAMVFELANGGRIAFLIDKARDQGAVESEAGETQLHGLAAPSAVVRIRASGAVEITAASGQSVTLQGGEQPFVRGTAYADALDEFLGQLTTLATALGTYATALGTGVPAAPLTHAEATSAATTLATALGTFAGAAAAFSAKRPLFLSTRVAGD